MRTRSRPAACRNCGRQFPEDELDDLRWCKDCRQQVIRRASLWSRGAAFLATLGLALWIILTIGPSTRFLVAWMAMLAATYLLVSRIVRRVAFEIVRARGVPPAQEPPKEE